MNVQRWMSRQFFIFFMTWGIFLPYWTGWMVDAKGISIAEASLIMSLGMGVRGLSTLFAFPYLSQRHSSKRLVQIMAAGTLAAVLLYIPAESFGSLLAATLLLHLFYPVLLPALDSAAGVLVQSGQLKYYGKSRSWGSLGFVVTGMVLTLFTGALGDGVILWAMLLGAIVLTGMNFLRTPEVLASAPERGERKNSGMLQLFKVRHFGLVLLIVILLQAAHASYYNYGYLYLQEIGTPKYMIGWILNIAVLAEITFFAKADSAFRKFTAGSLLTVAALGSSVRWLLVFAFPNVAIFILSQLLHAASFAMCHYAFMKYLAAYIPNRQIPNAQGMYSAFAMSWSTAVFTILGGHLYEFEPRYAFLGMLICTVPAIIIALYYRSREDKLNVQS